MPLLRLLFVTLTVTVFLTACGSPTPIPPATSSAQANGDAATTPVAATNGEQPAPTVTLDIILVPAPAECGPEAAITFAQTQNDLALAADTLFQQASASGNPQAADIGVAAFEQALFTLEAYPTPDCLTPARLAALDAFTQRILAFEVLRAGNTASYEALLLASEQARQTMLAELTNVLSQYDGS